MDPTPLTYPSWDDPRTQVWLISLINAIRLQSSDANARTLFQLSYSGAFSAVLKPMTNDYTGTWFVRWGSTNLIVSEGTSGNRHVARLLQGWSNYDHSVGQLGASDAFWLAASALIGDIGQSYFGTGQTWILAGHSFGGAQLHALAAIINNQFHATRIRGFSYGAPRPGGTGFAANVQPFSWTRWFCEEDPVPRIPPHTNEAPLLHFLVSNRLTSGCNGQVQPVGGVMLKSDGTQSPQETSPMALSISEPSLAAWMLGSNAFGAQTHALSEYNRRFGLAIPSESGVVPSRPRPTIVDEPQHITVRARDHATEAAAIASAAAGPFPNPAVVQVNGGPLIDRYTVRRHGRVWAIRYRGQVFGLCQRKREARAIARSWNRQGPTQPEQPPLDTVQAATILNAIA